MGRLPEARDLLTRALAIRQKAGGPDNAEIATDTTRSRTQERQLADRAPSVPSPSSAPAISGLAATSADLGSAAFRSSLTLYSSIPHTLN